MSWTTTGSPGAAVRADLLWCRDTTLGGLLADLTSTRTALAVAGLLVLTSLLLLPRRLGASSGAKVRSSRA
jgi:hypothetical protein